MIAGPDALTCALAPDKKGVVHTFKSQYRKASSNCRSKPVNHATNRSTTRSHVRRRHPDNASFHLVGDGLSGSGSGPAHGYAQAAPRVDRGSHGRRAKGNCRAEERTAEYAAKLRQARAEVYKIREQRVQQWNAERDAALDAARKAAGQKVSQARTEIEAEAAAAKQTIQGSAGDLAGQVVRAVLPVAAGGSR